MKWELTKLSELYMSFPNEDKTILSMNVTTEFMTP